VDHSLCLRGKLQDVHSQTGFSEKFRNHCQALMNISTFMPAGWIPETYIHFCRLVSEKWSEEWEKPRHEDVSYA